MIVFYSKCAVEGARGSKEKDCLGLQHLCLTLFPTEYHRGWLLDSELEVGSLVQAEVHADDVA